MTEQLSTLPQSIFNELGPEMMVVILNHVHIWFILCTIELCPAWMAQWQNHACLYYSYNIQSYIWGSTCSSNKHPWNTCISQQAGIPQFRILKQHMHPKTISKYKSVEMEVCLRHCFTFTHLHLVAICCLTMLTVMYDSSNFSGIVSTP